MEILLIALIVMLGYLIVKIRFSIIPVMRVLGRCNTYELKGKLIQSEVVLMPKGFDKWDEQLTLSKDGLLKVLEVGVLAEFDSLGDRKYSVGQIKLVGDDYFEQKDFGKNGVIASLTSIDTSFVNGHLNCSHNSYELIKNELVAGKVVMLRFYGYPGISSGNGFATVARKVNVLFDGDVSGPDYFFKLYKENYERATETEREQMKYFDDKFRSCESVLPVAKY